MSSKLGYIAMYMGAKIEIYAASLWEAKQKAVSILKVPRSKHHMVIVMLAEKDGEPVIHQPMM